MKITFYTPDNREVLEYPDGITDSEVRSDFFDFLDEHGIGMTVSEPDWDCECDGCF